MSYIFYNIVNLYLREGERDKYIYWQLESLNWQTSKYDITEVKKKGNELVGRMNYESRYPRSDSSLTA